MSGFVRLDRGAFDHPLLADPVRFKAWFWLVANACWKPQRFDIKGKTVTLQRGQICVSLRQFADATGMSKSAADRFLTRLQTETMIGTDSGTGRQIVTICNYDKYNPLPEKRGTGSGTPSGTAAGQQRDTKEQGNKGTSKSNDLQPDGVSDQVWSDFVDHRKRKKSDITQTAMDRLAAQARKAGWTMEDALAECVVRGWVGFNADWVEKREAPQTNDNPKSPAEWLAYCEEQVRKWRKVGDRRMIDEWEARERAARGKCGVVVPFKAMNEGR